MVSQTSRYYKTGTLILNTPNGDEIWYFRRRFVPDTSQDPVLTLHTVSQGERPDIISANHLGDPELFWRLCDANQTIRPEDLTRTAGKRIRIPLVTRS
jgi:hypothetical protein